MRTDHANCALTLSTSTHDVCPYFIAISFSSEGIFICYFIPVSVQFHFFRIAWIVTEGTCISTCKYKCVYRKRLLWSVSVNVQFKVHNSLFGSNFLQYNDCSAVSDLANCIEIILFGVVFMGENAKSLKKVTYEKHSLPHISTMGAL